MITRNRNRRGRKKSFLETDNERVIRRQKKTEVGTLTVETTKIPLHKGREN